VIENLPRYLGTYHNLSICYTYFVLIYFNSVESFNHHIILSKIESLLSRLIHQFARHLITLQSQFRSTQLLP